MDREYVESIVYHAGYLMRLLADCGNGDFVDKVMFGDEEDLQDVIYSLRDYPAADVKPVVKATWERIDYHPCGHEYECSSCGWKNDMVTRFCPSCGADMRESNQG